MPRTISHDRRQLLDTAMNEFWRTGYEATSMAALVNATGVNRAAIYADHGDKRGLFLACLEHYPERVVTPAFGSVEQPQASLTDVAQYFDQQITLAETLGLPGPGCLMANTMTELGYRDAGALRHVNAHNNRLTAGFLAIFSRLAQQRLSNAELTELATLTTISAQGIWSYSRSVADAEPLRQSADALISMISMRLNP